VHRRHKRGPLATPGPSVEQRLDESEDLSDPNAEDEALAND
jgi:hypothetical protein